MLTSPRCRHNRFGAPPWPARGIPAPPESLAGEVDRLSRRGRDHAARARSSGSCRRTPGSCTPDPWRLMRYRLQPAGRTTSPCSSDRRTTSASTASRSTRAARSTRRSGPLRIAEAVRRPSCGRAPVVRDHPAAHAREHSLEMQLPFLARVLPADAHRAARDGVPDARRRFEALADGLGRGAGRPARAARRQQRPVALPRRADRGRARWPRSSSAWRGFDADGLLAALERYPDHACGGGPIVSVMRAARALGARDARVLHYADSGDVSGDKSAVVGYMAAAFGSFAPAA